MEIIKPELPGPDFEFVVHAKLKHGELWKLVQKFGSQSALAKHLEITEAIMSGLVNLKYKSPPKSKLWPIVCAKLLLLTGKTSDELFPDWLISKDFLDMPKECDTFIRVSESELLNKPVIEYEPILSDSEDFHKILHKVLKALSPREQKILRLRFGLDGKEPLTLQEVSKFFDITKERIRQIEFTAIEKIKRHKLASNLIPFLDQTEV